MGRLLGENADTTGGVAGLVVRSSDSPVADIVPPAPLRQSAVNEQFHKLEREKTS
jgi:hypothetical protein